MDEPKKKSKFKIGCLGFIGIIIVFFIICAIGAGNNGNPSVVNTSSNTSNAPTTTQNSTTSPAPTTKTFKLGETIKIGNYDVTVSNLQNKKSIDDNYGSSISSTQNNFAIFTVTLKNNSNSPISSIDLGYQHVFTLSSDNTNYNINTSATISAFTVNNDSNSLSSAYSAFSTLSPNTPYSGFLVFETAKPINHGTIVVNLDGETANINF